MLRDISVEKGIAGSGKYNQDNVLLTRALFYYSSSSRPIALSRGIASIPIVDYSFLILHLLNIGKLRRLGGK
jgi:hypothetical protein